MKLKTTLIIVLFLSTAAFAQPYVHQVIIVNEGRYDYTNQVQTVPVTIGAYNPSTYLYQQFGTINNARFASHVIVDGASIYVAADSFIVRYDANTYQQLAITTLRGVRKLAVWNNQLLATRGEYLMTFNSYLSVLDKNTLLPLYSLPVSAGPQFSTSGVVVSNDKAYIAVNNGFEWGNEKGFIGILDLNTQTYLSEIDLGATGKNPEYLTLLNNELLTVNNRDYTAASISSVDIASSTVNTIDLGITSGCGGSVLAVNEILYQPSFATHLGKFNTQTMSNNGTLSINRNIYGMAHDDINNVIYMGETDFLTWGKVFIYQTTGTLVDSFTVSVAPGNIAFDVRTAASVEENNEEIVFSVYPNPVGNLLTVYNLALSVEQIKITDVTGREVSSNKLQASNTKPQTLDVSELSPGIYFITVNSGKRTFTSKFVKQ
jgi:hypothetical protein